MSVIAPSSSPSRPTRRGHGRLLRAAPTSRCPAMSASNATATKRNERPRHEKRRSHRRYKSAAPGLEAELGAKQRALPDRRYGVILADPAWRLEFLASRVTGMDWRGRQPLPDLAARRNQATSIVPSIAAKDSALFLLVDRSHVGRKRSKSWLHGASPTRAASHG